MGLPNSLIKKRKYYKKGITVPLTDALIAVIAKRHRVDVVTLDKHFKHFLLWL